MKKAQAKQNKGTNDGGAKKPVKSTGQDKKKSKMRKKIFLRANQLTATSKKPVGKEVDVDQVDVAMPKEMKPSVTNFKTSKEKVSSNWAAFKGSGLHLVHVKSKSSSDFKGVFRKRRKLLENGGTSAPSQKETDGGQNTIDCLDIEDSYITDLVPPDEKSLRELTKCVAIDCEMVGVGDGKESALARVSLVNQHGVCVYDKFVKPKEEVTDYRTKVSGVRPGDLALGEELEVVQKTVAKIVEGRILVGHAITHDLKVLFLSHPPNMIRDTSKFKPFRDMFDGRSPGLKKLAEKVLGVKIQDGEHSSVEDAKATMQLYNLYRKEWEEHRKLRALGRREKILKLQEAKKSGTSGTNKGNSKVSSDFPRIKFGVPQNKLNLRESDKTVTLKTPSTIVPSNMDEYVAF